MTSTITFQNQIIEPFFRSIKLFPENNAFCINEVFYSYKQFGEHISKIRVALQNISQKNNYFGIVANDDIETYASIFAIWLEGKAYVPLHPDQPINRCEEIIAQVKITTILDSCEVSRYSRDLVIATKSLYYLQDIPVHEPAPDDGAIAYVLFTSGSTGKPKGVPITRGNIAAFTDAFWDIGYKVDENDRFLQPFDLTFDLSVMSYLIPLLKGACVYPVPPTQIKYSYAAQLLEEHSLTVALMVPSTIRYLRPYFGEIELPALKYSLFCGEGLPLDLVNEWSKCTPNAFIDNVYGPTEDTIFCSHYRYLGYESDKSYNGILSIGKSMTSGRMIVVNNENNEIYGSEMGELCLAGNQLTPGYWNNPEKNDEVFFTDNNGTRFYKTGDLCFKDSEGDILFVGRKDSQAKIQGYRVELGEIEFHVKEFLQDINAVAMTFVNSVGNNEIALFIEKTPFELSSMMRFLNSKLPPYMIPTKVLFESTFPLNNNGKTDRNKLKENLK